MIKRYTYVLLSCLLAGVAAAQVNPNLENEVTRMVLAPVHELAEAEQDLIAAYGYSDVKAVDDILTYYPQLANTKVKDENGNLIPLVYRAFWGKELVL